MVLNQEWLKHTGVTVGKACGLSIISKQERCGKQGWKGSQGHFVQGFIGYDKVLWYYKECSVMPLKDFIEISFAL